jgi:hypothetical protein
VAIKILDANLLAPAGLLDAALGAARVDADHRQAESLKLGRQPRGWRSYLKAYPNWRI